MENETKRRNKRQKMYEQLLDRRRNGIPVMIDDTSLEDCSSFIDDRPLEELWNDVNRPFGWACLDYPGGVEQLRKDVETERQKRGSE